MQVRHFAALVLAIFLGSGTATSLAQPAGGNNELLNSLYTQLEALQQEVQTLRGVVEEQGYQLKRLQTEQRDRYLDIDRRLSSMAPAAPLTAGTVAPTAGNITAPAPTAPRSDLNESSAAANSAGTVVTLPPVPEPAATPTSTGRAAPAGNNPQDEQELYRTALNLLLQENKADESIALFQNYIDAFPQGRLRANALYWQGEAYLVVSGLTQARDVFIRVMTEYPQEAKAAAAMLKLGSTYKQMGETAKAAETWREIKVRYPESANEIRLSEEFLRAL